MSAYPLLNVNFRVLVSDPWYQAILAMAIGEGYFSNRET